MNNAQPRPNHFKRMLCLANSRKFSGRCVAGREFSGGEPGGWIRPVSEREHQELLECERQYEHGGEPEVLDVINVPLIRPHPDSFQQENWLVDPRFYWAKAGRCDWAQLQRFLSPVRPLWINDQSSHTGLNDRVALSQAEQLRTSLTLIHVGALGIEVFRPGARFGDTKRRAQGRFEYAGHRYSLWVTDPTYERRYLAQRDGVYYLGESCLTVSLGEPHEGFCYKLIAAIIERRQIEKR